jgi:hypothetical protein
LLSVCELLIAEGMMKTRTILMIAFALLATAGLAAKTWHGPGGEVPWPPADATPIPPEAVYLGTDMGGYFVTLSRVDLTDPEGLVVPAYRMQIFAAWANRKSYGAERVGGEVFKGIGIYVPPEGSRGRPEAYTPPDPALVLRQASEFGTNPDQRRFGASVNGNVLWIELPHEPSDDKRQWLAMVIPTMRK